MTEQTPKKLSRRDTIKILAAAAGAGALANLPSKWTKPGMDFGLLPAHAQTSQIIHTLLAGQDETIEINVEQPPITINSSVQITPSSQGILMHYSIVLHETVGLIGPMGIDSPTSLTGSVATNSTGQAILPITYSNLWYGSTITVTWSFENPNDGTGTDQQVFITGEPPFHSLVAGADATIENNVEQPPITIHSTAQITPHTQDIPLRYLIDLQQPQGTIGPNGIDVPLTGTVNTDGSGFVTLPITYSDVWFNSTITVTWSFENPSDGSGSDDQVFSTPTFD